MEQINDSPSQNYFNLPDIRPVFSWHLLQQTAVFFLPELLQPVLWRRNAGNDQGLYTREQKATQS